jgi:hypothetical protein
MSHLPNASGSNSVTSLGPGTPLAQPHPLLSTTVSQSHIYLNRLRSEFSGYTTDQLRLLDTRGAVIKSTNFVPPVIHAAAKVDSLGRHIHRTLVLLLQQLHPLFYYAIEQNISFGPLREQVAAVKAQIVQSIDALQLQADEYLVPPPDSGLQAAQRMVKMADKEAELNSLYPLPRSSEHKSLITKQLKEYDLTLSRSFVLLNDQYHVSLEAVRRAQTRLPTLRIERDTQGTIEAVLEHFLNYARSIALRLFQTVSTPGDSNLKSIAALLMTRAHLPNEEVADPLSILHLPGLLCILDHHFNRDTLSSYFEALIEVFNFQMTTDEATTNPEAAMTRLVYNHNDWSTRGLFQSLTQDLFFTCLMIKAIPPETPLRLRLITSTTQYMRNLQDGVVHHHSQSPVFDFVQLSIRQYMEDLRLSAHTGVSPAVPTSTRPPFRPRVSFAPNRASSGGFESAAATTTTPTTTSNASIPSVPLVDVANRTFGTEVLKTSNFGHNGHPYVAVRSLSTVCGQCFPVSNTSTVQRCPNFKRHYVSQCSKCKFFGHRTANCLQSVDTTGQSLVA